MHTIAGGYKNTASGYCVIAGGKYNHASGCGFIGGGMTNTVSCYPNVARRQPEPPRKPLMPSEPLHSVPSSGVGPSSLFTNIGWL